MQGVRGAELYNNQPARPLQSRAVVQPRAVPRRRPPGRACLLHTGHFECFQSQSHPLLQSSSQAEGITSRLAAVGVEELRRACCAMAATNGAVVGAIGALPHTLCSLAFTCIPITLPDSFWTPKIPPAASTGATLPGLAVVGLTAPQHGASPCRRGPVLRICTLMSRSSHAIFRC